MSKSIKRNNKYFGYDDESYDHTHEHHKQHLNEKRMRSALRAKNAQDLMDLYEEDYY